MAISGLQKKFKKRGVVVTVSQKVNLVSAVEEDVLNLSFFAASRSGNPDKNIKMCNRFIVKKTVHAIFCKFPPDYDILEARC